MSHMDADASDHWVIRKKWPRRLFWVLPVLAAIYLFPFPFGIVDEYTDRARVSELIVLTSNARVEVEHELKKNGPNKVSLNASSLIPAVLGVKTKDGERIDIAYREISAAGEVKVFAPQLGVLLIFTPTLQGKEVSWSCWGRPQKIVPILCRGDS